MKKLISLLLCVAMALCLIACTGIQVGPKETDMPDDLRTGVPTEEPTEAPTEEPTAGPTEEPTQDGLLCINSLDKPVTMRLLSYWNGCRRSDHDPCEPAEVSAGGFANMDYAPMSELQKRCSFAASDGELGYYVYDIELDEHDSIELRCEGEGAVFELVHEGKTSVFPACVYPDAEPAGQPDEHILSVNIVSASGQEAGDRLMHDCWQYATLSYEYTELAPECAELYPELAKALDDENHYIYGEIGFLYHSLCEGVQHSDDFDGRGDLTVEAFVRRADSKVYSVLYRFTQSAGDKLVFWNSGNYETETGKKLEISGVVKRMDVFTKAVNDKLAEMGSDIRVKEQDWQEHDNVGHPVWTLDRFGITVFIYGGDGVSCCLPFSEYPDMLRADFSPENEDYTMYFPLGFPACFETADGLDEVLLTCERESELSSSYVKAEYRGESYAFEQIEIGALAPLYFVTHADGMDFIHVFGATDNCDSLYTIAVQNGRLYYMGETACSEVSVHGSTMYDVPVWRTMLITDPGYFYIEYWLDVLGTDFGACPTAFCGDGLTKRLSDIFTFDHELTMLRDMEADEVDESGAVIGKVSLAQGDKVTYMRTDGMTYADLRTADGRIARLYVVVDWNEGEPTANGVPVSSLLEGICWV